MAQGFDPNKPAPGGPLDSATMRTQLNALASDHSGPTPPAPQEGMTWLDTSTMTMKVYVGGVWIEKEKYAGTDVIIDAGSL